MSAEPLEPLSSAERAVWRTFVDAGWGLLEQVNSEMSTRGLSQSDLRVLESLAAVPHRGISELACDVHMRVSTVSRQIARLAEEGAVERVASDGDGRHRLVRITDSGRDLLREHVLVRDRLIRELVLDVLTPEEYASVGEAFRKIRAGLDRNREC